MNRPGTDFNQRPQAELKPAASTFRRIGFGWLSLHGRIIRRRSQPEQEILAAAYRAARRLVVSIAEGRP
jgi:hypothetical protein